ncbi:MAG: ABC transporter permease, partial [Clostridia bacterium]|nr:ABC transporter permease [Clostridia bacterium]
VGMILSALYMFFRDVQYLWTVFIQLLMYMSAIFYDVSVYSDKVQRLFLLNPVYVYIKYFRSVVIDNALPSLEVNVLAIGYALIAFGIGALIYKKCNHKFLYYV